MAKKQDLINVKGLSIKDIQNLDYNYINSLDKTNIRRLANRLVSATNKRIRRLEQNELGYLAPALMSLNKKTKGNTQFSIKGKDRNEVLSTISKMQQFLKKETSSLTGFNKLRVKTRKRLGIKKWKSVNQEKKYWEMYRELVEETGGEDAMRNLYKNANKTGSDIVQLMLAQMYVKNDINDPDEVILLMRDLLKQVYESKESSSQLNEEEFFSF